MDSLEQQARDMLERMGIEDAQSFTAGDVVELANLIGERGTRSKAKKYDSTVARIAGNLLSGRPLPSTPSAREELAQEVVGMARAIVEETKRTDQ